MAMDNTSPFSGASNVNSQVTPYAAETMKKMKIKADRFRKYMLRVLPVPPTPTT
jgi:hypothetical protein